MKRQVLALLLAFAMVFASVFALTGCGKDKGGYDDDGGGLGDITIGDPGSGDGPSEPSEDPNGKDGPDGPADPADSGPGADGLDYMIKTELMGYIGQSAEDITRLFGDYDERTWYSGVIFRYGDLWLSFDGESEEPTGDLRFIFCSTAYIVEGLGPDVGSAELDELFGMKGIYDANENGASEWFSEGSLTYHYEGFKISFGCSPDMRVKRDVTAVLTAG
ncbi:MAG: hypothetical protein FWG03_00965 [Clostridiales bacterium]|nr:hypothetical protein [Clostridiales bacterium]